MLIDNLIWNFDDFMGETEFQPTGKEILSLNHQILGPNRTKF